MHVSYQVRLPTSEPAEESEEYKCHYHGRGNKNKPKTQEQPIVSQIAFSQNMYLMACLISGPINGVVVYGLNKEIKLELFSQIWFTTGPTDAPASKIEGSLYP